MYTSSLYIIIIFSDRFTYVYDSNGYKINSDMFVVECKDLTTEKIFNKYFYDLWKKNEFINKCKYSGKIKVLRNYFDPKLF